MNGELLAGDWWPPFNSPCTVVGHCLLHYSTSAAHEKLTALHDLLSKT